MKNNNEETRKIIIEFNKEYEKRNNLIKGLMSNTYYINWLSEYTEKYGGFSDQSRFHDKTNLPKEIESNINKLIYFLEGIVKYAEENYIYPKNDNGIYYIITYNNINYEIGFNIGQSIICFCTRSTKKDNAIDFNDILNNNKPERTEIIDNKLIELQSYLNSLINENIPLEALTETTQKVLQKVKR